jgi:hypothetical protein
MPKLDKRQIIILAVTAVVVLYGAYELLKPSAKKGGAPLSPGVKTASVGAPLSSGVKAPVTSAVMDATGSLSRDTSAKADAHIISRVAMDWRGDPFYAGRIPLAELFKDSAKAGAPGGMEKKADVIYMGYLKAGNREFAVINGIEYEAGDPVKDKPYVLKRIHPSKVVIQDRRDGTVFEVFLQDFLPD